MQVHFYTDPWKETRFHSNDHMEVVLILSDGDYFFVRNRVYPMTYGSLFVLNNADLHRRLYSPPAIYQSYSVRFYPEEIEPFSSESFDLLNCFRNHEHFNHWAQLDEEQIERLLALIKKLDGYLNGQEEVYGKEIYAKTTLAEILVYVNSIYRNPSQYLPPNRKEIAQLQPVIDYIQTHISEDLSLDTLAQQLFISKYYLSRRFKEVMGWNISEYITRCRLMNAKLLLRKDYSVALAGERSGFNSTSHFIRTFTKIEGLSPKQYSRVYLSSLGDNIP